MADYRGLYYDLFNAITDALENIENNQSDKAYYILLKAQTEAEEKFVAHKEKIVAIKKQ